MAPTTSSASRTRSTRTIHALVTGVVQGVGFRYHCAAEAQQLGLVGQVRNLPDGDVEVMAQGPADDVARLVAWLYKGPRWARVEQVSITDLRAGSLTGRRFEVTG
ncbi:acylphosphatase [Actinomyces lilanjuaniae]|uniref:acylphosphatase n=1 Tax=Actinomyces lilanjuaniae TaxID=2321394 RepID=A0ABM6Z487_9ACTO|nr:acylphosphatase [Actinomyces lilanjuaniae]AYD90167.1 acylphosphatase [Actinomyces lilanjuaniae]